MFKRFIPAAVLATLATGSFAQSTSITVVKGHVDKSYVTGLHLYKVTDGTNTEIATQTLNEQHNYAFALTDVKEGFYYIGDGMKMQEVRTRFYLKAGDQLELNLHDKSYDMNGGSEENKVLDQWQQLVAPVMDLAYHFWTDREGYTGFFPILTDMVPKAQAFHQQIHTSNAAFNSLMHFVVDNDLQSAAVEFLFTPRTKHPDWKELPAFYKTIRADKKYCSADILKLGDGAGNRLSLYASFCALMDKKAGTAVDSMLTPAQSIMKHMQLFCNDTVKGAFLVGSMAYIRDFSTMQSIRTACAQYLVTDTMKSRFMQHEKALASFAKGEKAFNFVYPDTKEQKVAMSDLKGKVVVVDVWATWCGPCKRELPFMKQLEEEMKGKNVAFVSISVDQEKDKEKWKKMIADEQMGGIQLFAGTPNDMSKYYNISGIPRFMVFDQQGKIVNADAPRPSVPELKQLLEKTLGEPVTTSK